MRMICDCLSQVMRGEPLPHQTLTMAPLLALDRCEPGDLTLDEMLARGHLHITELSESGSVTELRLINRAWQAVILFDGADVDGAEHERVPNFSLLTSPAALATPFSCVQAGRRSSARPVLLLEIAAAHASTHPSFGEGKDMQLTVHRLSGGPLLAQDRVAHLCICRLPTAESQDTYEISGRMAIASVRRRGKTY